MKKIFVSASVLLLSLSLISCGGGDSSGNKASGTVKTLYDSGEVKEIVEYKDGKQEGVTKEFYKCFATVQVLGLRPRVYLEYPIFKLFGVILVTQRSSERFTIRSLQTSMYQTLNPKLP